MKWSAVTRRSSRANKKKVTEEVKAGKSDKCYGGGEPQKKESDIGKKALDMKDTQPSNRKEEGRAKRSEAGAKGGGDDRKPSPKESREVKRKDGRRRSRDSEEAVLVRKETSGPQIL